MLNLYTSYITVAVRKAGATAGTYTDCLDDLEISFNGNSNGVLSREVSLYSVSSMIGLPNGGSAGKITFTLSRLHLSGLGQVRPYPVIASTRFV